MKLACNMAYLATAQLDYLDHVIHFDGFFFIIPRQSFNWIGFGVDIFEQKISVKYSFNKKYFNNKNIAKLVRERYIKLYRLFSSILIITDKKRVKMFPVTSYLHKFTKTALNTKNRYGFTYGNYGLISIQAFSKYTFIYLRLVLIFYKLMQNKNEKLSFEQKLPNCFNKKYYYNKKMIAKSIRNRYIRLYHLFSTFIITSVLGVIIVSIQIEMKLHQNWSAISSINFIIDVNQFTLTLSYLFEVNQMYLRVFTANLCLHCPVNVLMSMWMFDGHIPWATMFIIAFFIVYQFIIIFILHLQLIKSTQYIHRPVPRLYSILIQISSYRKPKSLLRNQLCLCSDIMAFNTTHRYGFTYGSFGLVSILALFKNALFYGRFILIAYKLQI
ncbi:hypothetical protein BLOT_013780 [Blomia tropicalis]|nr:hypothetical protein BLOT_013780 [Blomia tropicalis]